jgi:LuxR family maltose regulon positive regulatory protein
MWETGNLTPDGKELNILGIRLDSETFKGYKGQVCQLRAYIALKYENMADILRYSEQALKELPATDISCVTLHLILGYIYRSLGELKQAESYFSNALVISEREESESLIILSNFYINSIKYLKGELDDFITPLNKMLGQNITHKNCMYFCLATTYYDYSDFEMAYTNVMKGLELCNTYEDIFYEKVKGFVLLARILFHTGKIAEAVDVMNQIDSLVKPDCGNMFVLLELPGIVNMLVLLGLINRAEMYIRKFTDMKCKDAECMLSQAQAELSLALNDYEYAIDRLMFILTNMDSAVYPKKRIDLLILLSITYHAYRKDEEALEYLQKALETKGVERNIRAFIDRGKPMHELLVKFIDRSKKNPIELTTIAEELVTRLKNKDQLKGHFIEGFERLSGREMEVLRLLAQGFSYEEIGRTLFISLSTVKKHTSNIYYKLKAGNKIQAINIAKANGLVG